MIDHDLWKNEHFGTDSPCVNYELKPLVNPQGEAIEGLNTAWIVLNNPTQLNSYTTEIVKGVIAGFSRASMERSVVAVVFTAVGDRAFCTGGNTKEYAEYYSGKPAEYGLYMDLFNGMVDSILNCKKPVLCRVNGMRVAGGQEIGMACDLTVAADTAIFGQAGPRHGSAPDGGSTDFLPWYLSIEDAVWNCISCELWSAYKMKRLGLITKVVPVLQKDGQYIRNPTVHTNTYVEDGEIVYGEFISGEAMKKAREVMKSCATDHGLLDKAIDEIIWSFANLFPGCLMKSIDGIRMKKKFFWDQMKLPNRHWLASNMSTEALLGFRAFNERKMTGKDTIDFIKYRQLLALGHPFDQELIDTVLPKPRE
ncbi:MAG: 6-oxocyclohex-1-ene-1-carbonyl-CoA hydratase [Candidatus Heimdallarchaeota archaeon]